VSSLRTIAEKGWTVIWLFGPSINLIHGSAAIVFYLVGTVLVAGLLLAATTRKKLWAALTLGACAVFVWLLSGFLAIAILT
jgi:hypothetical protein